VLLGQEPAVAGDRTGQVDKAPGEPTEAQQSRGPSVESAAQVASRQAGEGEQAGEVAVKGYEIEVKKEKQSSGAGRKAVTALAILGALAI